MLLSVYIRRKKVEYFFRGIPQDNRILEIGCGDGWRGRYLKAHGWMNYSGLDLAAPADFIGDIQEWRKLGLTQRRTSPHNHLIDFRDVPFFEVVSIKRVGLAAQWGILRKPAAG
jgi:hypothetical protein